VLEGVVVTAKVETFTITWSVTVTVVLLQLVYFTCAVYVEVVVGQTTRLGVVPITTLLELSQEKEVVEAPLGVYRFPSLVAVHCVG
jgi:hypothetical protein